MKYKILFIVMLIASAIESRAQYSSEYYHRVGDTIEWRSEIGYYTLPDFEFLFDNDIPVNILICPSSEFGVPLAGYIIAACGVNDSLVLVQRFYTPTPLRVVGLAGGGVRHDYSVYPHNPNFSLNIDTSDSYKNYFVIYDAMPDSFPLVGKLEWNLFDPHRTLHLMHHSTSTMPGDTFCCHHAPCHKYLPIYEYYFDSAITVSDSFYVGGTFFGDSTRQGSYLGMLTAYWGVVPFNSFSSPCGVEGYYDYTRGLCTFPSTLNKAKFGINLQYGDIYNRTFSESPWEWVVEDISHFLIYPLIEVDTTVPPPTLCDSVANVQVTPSGTSATVTWDDFPYYSRVLLRYGVGNAPLSQWTEIDVTGSTHYFLEGLQPEMRYGVAMKAECDTSKKATPWSPPVYFWTGADTTGGGTERIEGGTLLSRLTFLRPNPARDEVQVTSSFSIREIEIWGSDGVLVYHSSVFGHEATVDVSYLHAGTYIVAVHTLNGTTHKRLVIAR